MTIVYKIRLALLAIYLQFPLINHAVTVFAPHDVY